uniref:Uncharacterized protein n=1 Tax=Trichogramma kaykai TaxID=54128 RepID=A0ABD2XHT6_9HYME
MKMFFQLSQDRYQPVQVDARDKVGVHIVYRAKRSQEHLHAPMQTRRRALNCPKRAPSNGQRVVVLQEGSQSSRIPPARARGCLNKT